MEPYKNLNQQFIDGEWIDGSSSTTIVVENPFDHSELTTLKGVNATDVDMAYQAAKKAAQSWGKSNFTVRRDILEKAVQIAHEREGEFIDWIIRECGGTHLKAHIEMSIVMDILKEAASMPARLKGVIFPSSVPGKESRAYRKPLGVIGVISPWNFPMVLSLRSVAYAIATGNAVVLKPADQTPVSGGLLLAKLFEEAGLPKGVLNVTVGTIADIGNSFVEHPVPRMISFTGSTPVGRLIGELCGKHLKKAALELGGNNAFIVREDADVDYAVSSGMFGRFVHQGQICMSINRFLIHESIYDEFAAKFTDKVNQLKAGNPADPTTDIGPLIERRQVDRILQNIELSIQMGAEITTGGKANDTLMEPTVMINATNDMPLSCNEIFGPVAVLIPFKDDEEAIQLANASENGLSSAIHTKDLDKGVRIAQQIETGMIHVNDQTIGDEAHAIFGGEKASGLNRFNGDYILEEFTTLQWVTVQYEHRPYPW